MSIGILCEASKGRRPQGTAYKRLGHFWRAWRKQKLSMREDKGCPNYYHVHDGNRSLFFIIFILHTKPTKRLCKPSQLNHTARGLFTQSSELSYHWVGIELRERNTNVWFLQHSEFGLLHDYKRKHLGGIKKKIIHAIFLWLKRAERHGPRCYNMALLSKARTDAGAETLCRPGQSRSVWRAKARNSVTSFHRMETSALCR